MRGWWGRSCNSCGSNRSRAHRGQRAAAARGARVWRARDVQRAALYASRVVWANTSTRGLSHESRMQVSGATAATGRGLEAPVPHGRPACTWLTTAKTQSRLFSAP